MTFIYTPHVCDLPTPNTNGTTSVPVFEAGTIWQCSQCDRHWRYREMFSVYLGEWKPVRPWSLIARRRIRKANP